MERRILVPLDGSELGEQVLPHAATLARATGSGLTLLQVVPTAEVAEHMVWPIALPVTGPGAGEPPVSQARDYLHTVASRWRATGLDVEVETPLGEPAHTIVDWATKRPGITMIAMATHGRSGPGRWIFGSVAEKVLHAVAVPLLLVPGHAAMPGDQEAGYRTILVPLDGSLCAERALSQAAVLARATQARLVLLTVVPPVEDLLLTGMVATCLVDQYEAHERIIKDYLRVQAQDLDHSGVGARTQVRYGHPATAILAVGEDEDCDLIVMGTHGRTGWQRFWLGCVAMKVVQAATQPVLLVRGEE